MSLRNDIRAFFADGPKTHDQLKEKFGESVLTALSQLTSAGELHRSGAAGARTYRLIARRSKTGSRAKKKRVRPVLVVPATGAPRAPRHTRHEREAALRRAEVGRSPLIESALESLRRQHDLTGRAIEALEQCTGLQA